ncbi:MAG TPA: universal stress protein [Candidatus Nitrosotenuis sp.]|nr:universal stress protein [Candidatus Nitrosotenuis sp.]
MNVLLATHGSRAAQVAEQFLLHLPLPQPSYVAVVRAVGAPVLTPVGGGKTAEHSPEIREALQQAAQAQRRQGVEASVLTVVGEPDRSLLKLAAELPADLVVVGASGRLGPVASRLANQVPCPLAVARDARPVGHLLLALGPDERWKLCLDFLLAFAWPPQTRLSVLSVHQGRGSRDILTAILDEAARRLQGRGLSADIRLREGDPATQILAAAQELQPDLLVAGSRGLGLAARMLLGSVSERVLQEAPGNVVVVRGRVPSLAPLEDRD